ncbi:MAG: hypothetical protein ACLUFN_06730 [Eubacterium sp.]
MAFVYSYNGEKAAQLGLTNTIIGNAALWSMLLALIAIKKLGKRNLLIICNALNIVMYPAFKSLVMICVLCYINNFVNTFRNIYIPAINADKFTTMRYQKQLEQALKTLEYGELHYYENLDENMKMAKQLLVQEKNYNNLDKIEELYHQIIAETVAAV